MTKTTKLQIISLLLVFALVAVAAALMFTNTSKANAAVSLNPDTEVYIEITEADGKTNFNPGDTLTLVVTLHAGSNHVGAFDVDNLKYSKDKYEFVEVVSYNTAPSEVAIADDGGEGEEGEGLIHFSFADSTGVMTGDFELFRVTLRVKSDAPQGTDNSIEFDLKDIEDPISDLNTDPLVAQFFYFSPVIGGAITPPQPEPSHNTTLASVSVGSYTSTTPSGKTYSITIPATLDSAAVSAVSNYNATIVIKKNGVAITNPVSFSSGDTTFTIDVTAEDGTTTDQYTLVVTKSAPALSSNTTLASVSVGSYTSTTPSGKTYSITIPHTVDSAVVSAVSNYNATIGIKMGNVSVTGSPVAFSAGDTILTIDVTAEDGTTTDQYTLVVTKESAPVTTSSKITAISVKGNPATISGTTCTVYVPYSVNSLGASDISVTLEDSEATYVIKKNNVALSGDVSIAVGNSNHFTIEVTPKVGSVATYALQIHRRNNQVGIKDLKVDGNAVTETDASGNYVYTVSHSTRSVTISAGALYGGSIKGDTVGYRDNLKTGNNTFQITAYAEDHNYSQQFTLIVIRESGSGSSERPQADTYLTLAVAGNNTTVIQGGEITVTGTFECGESTIGAIELNLLYDTNVFRIKKVDGNNALTYFQSEDCFCSDESAGQLIFYWIDTEGLQKDASNNVLLFTITFVVLDDAQTGISIPIFELPEDEEIVVSDVSEEDQNLTCSLISVDITITEPRSEKELASAVIRNNNASGAILSGSVDQNTKTYVISGISRGITQIYVDSAMVVENSGATVISGIGQTHVLNYGGLDTYTITNAFTIQAEDGSTTTYNIQVSRIPEDLNTNATITFTGGGLPVVSLESDETLKVISKQVEYANISSVSAQVRTAHQNANVESVTLNGSTYLLGSTMNLIVGENTMEIVVKNGSQTTGYTVKFTVKAASTGTDLTSVYIAGSKVDPQEGVYRTSVGYLTDKVTISATAQSLATVTNGTGEVDLVAGTDNVFYVRVTAEAGNYTDHQIVISRDAPSQNTELQGITIRVGSASGQVWGGSWNGDVYEISGVPFTTTAIYVSATAKSPAVLTSGNNETHTLDFGDGNVCLLSNIILVTAQDTTVTKSYSVQVTRVAADQNTNASIVFVGTGLSFSKLDLTPGATDVTVPTSIPWAKRNDVMATVSVEASTSYRSDITVKGDPFTNGSKMSLDAGENVLSFTVTSQGGAANTTYTVKLIVSEPSSDNSLANVYVTGTTVTKDGDVYKATVPYKTTSVTISATVHDSTATIIDGLGLKENLVAGQDNTFTISVLAENGIPANHSVVVFREGPSTETPIGSVSVRIGSETGTLVKGTWNGNVYEVSGVAYTTEYVYVTATAAADTTVNGSGRYKLSFNTEDIALLEDIVVVTAQDNLTTGSYSVQVKRVEANKNTNASLTLVGSGLSFSTINLQSETNEYTVSTNIPYAKREGYVSASVATAQAESRVTGLTLNGQPYTEGSLMNLVAERNTLTISVNSQGDAASSSYVVYINVIPASSQKTITTIKVNNNEVTTKDGDDYIYTVPFTTKNATVNVTPCALASVVSVDAHFTQLSYEQVNQVDITIRAEDGSTAVYYLYITRETPSSATPMGIIKVRLGSSNGTLVTGTWDDHVYEISGVAYTTEKVYVQVIAAATTSITGTGLYTLEYQGDSALLEDIIVVTAQDNTTVDYYSVRVTRVETDKNTNATITFSGSGLTFEPVNLTPGQTSYTVSTQVPYAKRNNVVTATASVEVDTSSISGFKLNGENYSAGSAMNLRVGDNTIELVVSSQGASVVSTYSVKLTVIAPSDEKVLTYVKVNGVDAEQDGDTYTATVPYKTTSVTVTTATKQPAVIKSQPGKWENLEVGENSRSITVEAENGTTKVYNVIVTREGPSSETPLGSITVNLGSASGEVLNGTWNGNVYEISGVPYTTARVYVNVSPATDTTVTGTNLYTLRYTDDIALLEDIIVVTAQDRTTTQAYSVQIKRVEAGKNTNATLTFSGSGLSISPIELNSEIANYTVETEVPYAKRNGVVSANVSVVQNTSRVASFTLNGTDYILGSAMSLVEGNNTLVILVASQGDVVQTEYIVNLIVTAASDQKTLTSVKVDNVDAVPDGENYAFTVPYTTKSVTVSATACALATITVGTGSITLRDDTNVTAVKITVKAENGTTKDYILNITQEDPSSDTTLGGIEVRLGTQTGQIVNGTWDGNVYKIEGIAYNTTHIYVTVTATPNTVTTGTNRYALGFSDGVDSVLLDGIISVTAQDNVTTATYSIQVERSLLGRNTNAQIAFVGAGLSFQSINLISSITNYTVSTEVPYAKRNGVVSATVTLEDQEAQLVSVKLNNVNYVAGSDMSLNVGDNTIAVRVLSSSHDVDTTYIITLTVSAPSSDKSLEAVMIDGTEVFAQGDKYCITVPYKTTAVTVAAAAKAPATITSQPGNWTDLGVGDNSRTIVVTAEDGTSKVYTVIVTRTAPSSDVSIGDIVVRLGSNVGPTIDGVLSENNYVIAGLPTGTKKVHISAKAAPNTTVSVSNDGLFDLQIVNSTAVLTNIIVVTAEDGVTQQYYSVILTCIESAKDTNAIISVTIDGANHAMFVLSPRTSDYSVEIPHAKKDLVAADIELSGSASSLTKITLNGSIYIPQSTMKLSDTAENVLLITVASQGSEVVTTYRVVINIGDKLSDTSLESVTINGIRAIAKGENVFEFSVAYTVSEIDIGASAVAPAKIISGIGTKSLAVGRNSFEIVVEAENGTTQQTYTLIVDRRNINAISQIYAYTASDSSLEVVRPMGRDDAFKVMGAPTQFKISMQLPEGSQVKIYDPITGQEYQPNELITRGANTTYLLMEVTDDNGDKDTYTIELGELSGSLIFTAMGDALLNTSVTLSAQDQVSATDFIKAKVALTANTDTYNLNLSVSSTTAQAIILNASEFGAQDATGPVYALQIKDGTNVVIVNIKDENSGIDRVFMLTIENPAKVVEVPVPADPSENPGETPEEGGLGSKLWMIIAIVMGVMFVVMVIIVIVMASKNKKVKHDLEVCQKQFQEIAMGRAQQHNNTPYGR